MFRGASTVSMDAKGRLAVPARYRDVLLAQGAGKVVVTADPTGCLLLYPFPDWAPIEQKLNALSSFNPQTRRIQRLLVGYANDLDLDASGRLLLPPMLREYAALDKNVVVVGQGNKMELWSEAGWRAQVDEARAVDGAAMPAELDGFSL